MNTKSIIKYSFAAVVLVMMICGIIGLDKPTVNSQLVKVSPIKVQKKLSPIKYRPSDSASIAIMNGAMELLKSRCRNVENYTTISEEIFCEYDTANTDYRFESHRWKKQVMIDIKVPDDGPPQMAGHVLHYFIGRGKKPGIEVNKIQAAILCDSDAEWNGSNLFYPVEDVPFLE